MNTLLQKLHVIFLGLISGQEGQDLVEYALLVALVALAAIGGVHKVAGAITSVFTNISSSLANA
jgi:pilus assembly protein Flp/PilA